jgi:peptide/nickel transport system substrate-binding protein
MTFVATTRRHFLQSAVGAAGLAAIDPWSKGMAGSPRRGGTLTVLIDPEPPVLTTIAHSAGSSVLISAKVNEGLLEYDFDLRPVPQLATTWSISPDGLEYTFNLRRDVKWHDGKDFTASDVVFSILTLKEYHPRGRSTFSTVTEVRAPDPYTAVVVLSRPTPYLITAFAASESPIVAKHVYENSKVDQNPVSSAPVGTGPFVFKEWVRGSHVLFERNPHYWDQPKPYVDRLVIRFLPDPASRAAAIETGQVQLAPGNPVPLGDLDRFKALKHLTFDTRGYQYTNNITRIEFNLERPLFQDLRVRQAFAHSIDRKALLDIVWYGYGQPVTGPIHPNLKRFYVPDLAVPAFDVAAANRLLDQAGHPRGADGFRFKVSHDPLPYGDGFKRGGEFIKNALAKIGVDVTLRTQDFATYIRRVYTDRDFDFTYNMMSNLFDPTVGVQRLYWSKNFKKGVPFSNGSGYANPDVDRLLEAAAVEIDESKRLTYFTDFQRIIAHDLPDFGVLAPDTVTIADRKVVNHTVSAQGVGGNLANVFLETS